MAKIRRIPLAWTTLFTNIDSVNGTFIPMTPWMSASDVAKARCTWESSGETVANMVTRPGYQVADVENSVSSTNTLGSDTQTGNAVKYASAPTDISSVTQSKQLVRWGLWVKNPAGTTTVQCVRGGGVMEVEDST